MKVDIVPDKDVEAVCKRQNHGGVSRNTREFVPTESSNSDCSHLDRC